MEIIANEVRLTGLNGEKIGILTLADALRKAEKSGVDLVEISPNTTPPVCRIMDYGKFLYEKNKFIKEQKKKQKVIHIKEIKFRPNTDESDYIIKIRSLKRFLKNGNKVKITLRFRGREIIHQKLSINILSRIRDDLEYLSVLEFFPKKIESRQMTMILSPKKNIGNK